MSFIAGLGFLGDYDVSVKFGISIMARVVWRGLVERGVADMDCLILS